MKYKRTDLGALLKVTRFRLKFVLLTSPMWKPSIRKNEGVASFTDEGAVGQACCPDTSPP